MKPTDNFVYTTKTTELQDGLEEYSETTTTVKRWIYRAPAQPRHFRPRKLRRGKVHHISIENSSGKEV